MGENEGFRKNEFAPELLADLSDLVAAITEEDSPEAPSPVVLPELDDVVLSNPSPVPSRAFADLIGSIEDDAPPPPETDRALPTRASAPAGIPGGGEPVVVATSEPVVIPTRTTPSVVVLAAAGLIALGVILVLAAVFAS